MAIPLLPGMALGFDFDILAEESGMLDDCRRLARDHVDMMFHVVCQLGFGVSLDSAARGMAFIGKARGTVRRGGSQVVGRRKATRSP